MSEMRRPGIVVGIDVGQTCSGVAYSFGPDWSDPRTLNCWPSAHGIEKADKVPTRVGYNKAKGTLENWGFESVWGDDNFHVREQFKLTLDPNYQDDRGSSSDDAMIWYMDYLTCLHREIEKFFDDSVPTWRNFHVEYNFSTPTTWTNPAMIATIERLIKAAGFASTTQQTVRMASTEAEAAAVEASTTQYREGEVFLICDAGGGTSDFNLLKVKSLSRRIGLEPLDHVEGVPVGSTLIDFKMANHIEKRLKIIKEHLEGDPQYLADGMLTGLFQSVKHSFPHHVVEQFFLEVKGLTGLHNFPEAGITNSKMAIDRSVLKDIFDQQINKIFGVIDDQLLFAEERYPNTQVSYIILSGGLGSSNYLCDEIKRRYEMNFGFRSSNTAAIRVVRVADPQLAVVRGIVRERTQQLGISASEGQEVFTSRRCRNSYGIAVRVAYDESKHRGLPVITDRFNGRRWVENVVDWFIKQGEELSVKDGVSRLYGATLAETDHQNIRQAQIVMSSLPVQKLPLLTTDPDCKDVALVSYRLTGNDMKLKNRQFWKLKKKYWKAEFYFVVKIGPADLRFQIEGKNGVLSSSHDSLRVEFIDPSDQNIRRLPSSPAGTMPTLGN